jgi:proteasome lid subunit RPN8/RPN11
MILFQWPILSKMISEVEPYASEQCGFLFGLEGGKDTIITRIMPVKNEAPTEDALISYQISLDAYRQAELTADEEGIKLMGVYHSHPNRLAIPSPFDLEAALPNFIYVIISVRNRKMEEVRSWKLNQSNNFEENMIDFIPSSCGMLERSLRFQHFDN